MDALSVFRMDGSEPRLLGRINLDPVTFSYDPGYLADPDARAVSCSLPLRNEAYSESTLVPYFDGLLPEGAARRAIAAQLGISQVQVSRIERKILGQMRAKLEET